MGLDLRLLPLDSYIEGKRPDGTTSIFGFSHTILNAPRGTARLLRDMIDAGKFAPAPLPDGHDVSAYLGGRVPDGSSEGERVYGTLDRDAYGDRYTWARASTLAILLRRCLSRHSGHANPTIAYLAALDPDTLVVLDWC